MNSSPEHLSPHDVTVRDPIHPAGDVEFPAPRIRERIVVIRSRNGLRRSAFTIVEVAAVITLLAILTSAAAISLRPSLDKARQDGIARRIELLDGRLRDQAQRQNRILYLRVDMEDGEISEIGNPVRTIKLGSSLRIDRLRTSHAATDSGELRIAISPLGQSDSYAIRLHSSSGRQLWIVVFGLTGQCLKFEEDLDAEKALSRRSS